MTRPLSDYDAAVDLLNTGLPQAEVARRTGIPRSTIRTWIANGRPGRAALTTADCQPCDHVQRAETMPEYAYLLGLWQSVVAFGLHPKLLLRGLIRLFALKWGA